MTQGALEDYFRAQQVAPQWALALRALAAELAEQVDEDALRELFRAVGARMAESAREQMSPSDTLSELQDGLNAFWLARQWGWAELSEQSGVVAIVHHAAPLAEAFGDKSLVWSCGLLEGFYQDIFHALGASDDLVVDAVESSANGLLVRLQLGQ